MNKEKAEIEKKRQTEEEKIRLQKLKEHQQIEDEIEKQMEEARKLSVQIRIKEELERLREQVKFGRICRFENCMYIDMRLNMVGVFCISYSYNYIL